MLGMVSALTQVALWVFRNARSVLATIILIGVFTAVLVPLFQGTGWTQSNGALHNLGRTWGDAIKLAPQAVTAVANVVDESLGDNGSGWSRLLIWVAGFDALAFVIGAVITLAWTLVGTLAALTAAVLVIAQGRWIVERAWLAWRFVQTSLR